LVPLPSFLSREGQKEDQEEQIGKVLRRGGEGREDNRMRTVVKVGCSRLASIQPHQKTSSFHPLPKLLVSHRIGLRKPIFIHIVA
jgi:hypothetical protein